MPTKLLESAELRPTFIAKPDMRFATTFISDTYRDYSVNGETIQDKVTGEIFTKRPDDGRVVSFFQNKKYMYDLMLELRVLLTNNEAFKYPKNTYTGFYLSTDYDLIAINDELKNDITVNNTVISNATDTTRHQLRFNLSKDTNGFFCRPTSRDADKPVISWLTNQYNYIMKNYSGTDAAFLAEKKKFTDIEKWEDCNTILYYNVTVTNGSTTRTYTCKEYIHINENMCIQLPNGNIASDFPDGYTKATVEITSLDYYKLHFMITNKNKFGSSFTNGLSNFISVDSKIFVNYLTIGSFVDNSQMIELLGNEFIVAMLDIPYISRYMMKMSRLKENSDFILSDSRPGNDDWATNAIWAEHIRDVFEGGFTINKACEVDLKRMERYLAKNNSTYTAAITEDSFDNENFYMFNPSTMSYTDEEIDRKISRLKTYVSEKADGIVSDDPGSVSDDGIVLETLNNNETEE